MEEDASWKLTALLDALPQSRNKLQTVEEISVVLSAVTPASLRAVVPNLSFSSIFECLSLCSGREQVETCCSVLRKLLDAVHPAALLSNFHSELLIGLDAESDVVQNLCLTQVLRIAESKSESLSNFVDVIKKVIQLISSTDSSTHKLAVRAVTCIGKTENDFELLLMQPDVLSCFEHVLEQSDEARFRLYECLIDISVGSPSGLVAATSCGLCARLLSELDTDDVLAQLNCLELLTSLAACDHGLQYLQHCGTLDQLEDKMVNASSDPLGELLVPGLLKVFGSACRAQPVSMLNKYSRFAAFLFSSLDSNVESSSIGVAVETIGFIGSTPNGKRALASNAEMQSACGRLGDLFVNAPTILREKAIESVTHLIMIPEADQTPELLSLSEDWFSHLGRSADDSLATVLHIAQQPFKELRVPSLRLVNVLARLPWGHSRLVQHPGFLEYLLDRSTEHGDRGGLEAKYTVVLTLVESPATASAVAAELFQRLREYARDGPLYVKLESQVAFESGQ